MPMGPIPRFIFGNPGLDLVIGSVLDFPEALRVARNPSLTYSQKLQALGYLQPFSVTPVQIALQGPQREAAMGFLSSITGAIKKITSPIVKTIGGIFPAGSVIGDAARTLSPSIGRAAVPIAAAAAGVGAGYLGAQMLAPSAAGAPDGSFAGGNGRYVTVTTISTIDTVTGQTVRQKMLQGSPYLMNRDLMVAKRVLRTAGKLGSRFSRKTREPSKTKQLMDAIQDRALGAVLSNAAGCSTH